MNWRNINQEGFTLIEAMVALLVLAVGLIALIGLQTSSLRLNQKNLLAEVGKDTLVSEIDSILPLSNLELRTATNIGQQNNINGLGTPFNTAPYNTAPADTVVPNGFDYCRYSGISRTLLEGVNGVAGMNENYLIKICVDKKYLLQDVLARCRVTVYWPSPKRGLDFLETTFFTQRK